MQKVCKTSSQSIAGCSGIHLSSLASEEAEIKRIMVPGQSRQKKPCDTPFKFKKLGLMLHTCYSNYSGSVNRKLTILVSLGKNQDSISKITRAKSLEVWLKW
jgi:hypothetical protein